MARLKAIESRFGFRYGEILAAWGLGVRFLWVFWPANGKKGISRRSGDPHLSCRSNALQKYFPALPCLESADSVKSADHPALRPSAIACRLRSSTSCLR